jgi:hypothetical protein
MLIVEFSQSYTVERLNLEKLFVILYSGVADEAAISCSGACQLLRFHGIYLQERSYE